MRGWKRFVIYVMIIAIYALSLYLYSQYRWRHDGIPGPPEDYRGTYEEWRRLNASFIKSRESSRAWAMEKLSPDRIRARDEQLCRVWRILYPDEPCPFEM